MLSRDLFETRHPITEAVTKRPWTFYHGTNSDAFDRFAPELAAKGEQYWNPLGSGMYATNNSHFAYNFGKNVYKIVIPAGATYKRINMNLWQSLGFSMVMKALANAFKAGGDNLEHWINGTPKPLPGDPKKMSREQIIDALVAFYSRYSNDDVRSKTNTLDTNYLRRELMSLWKNHQEYVRDSAKERQILSFKVETARTLRQNDPYTGLYEVYALANIDFGKEIGDAFGNALAAESDRRFGKFDFVVFTETNDPFIFKDNESTSEVVIFNPAYQKTR